MISTIPATHRHLLENEATFVGVYFKIRSTRVVAFD